MFSWSRWSLALSTRYFGLTLTYSLLIAINLVGNTMVIFVVLLNKSMQRPINYLLVNLAASDMTVAIFASIQFLVKPMVSRFEPLAATFLCKFVTGGTLGWVGAVCSIFNLVGISIERYYAVIVPHRHRGKLTNDKLRVFSLVSWILALIWASPGFFITILTYQNPKCADTSGQKRSMQRFILSDGYSWLALYP